MELELSESAFVLCVCGGRDYSDAARVFEVLDKIHAKMKIALLVNGGASGADRLSSAWASSRGVALKEFPAQWKQHGRAAGPIRNGQMVAYGLNALVVFPGGRGTEDMARQCRASNITVWRAS